MLNSIKKYLKKAKEEASREYVIPSGHEDEVYETITVNGESKRVSKAWIGVDLDGTLAHYERNQPFDEIGDPVPDMLALVKKMIANQIRVKIFTARAVDPDQVPLIRQWLVNNGLPELEITNVKDYSMRRLYDDRCIQVERNTGRLIVDD